MACYSLVKINNFWKLDKIDKFFISFIFIIITFFCLFSTYSKAYETELIFTRNDNFNIRNDILVDNDTTYVGGFYAYPVEAGITYTFENLSGITGFYILGFVNNLETGEIVERISTGSTGLLSSISFEVPSNGYLILTFDRNSGASNVEGFRVIYDSKGISSVISELTDTTNISFFDDILVKVMPFVGVVVLFSLGVWFIKHNIIEHSKGRDF